MMQVHTYKHLLEFVIIQCNKVGFRLEGLAAGEAKKSQKNQNPRAIKTYKNMISSYHKNINHDINNSPQLIEYN